MAVFGFPCAAPDACGCPPDLTYDGTTDAVDLLLLLAAWGSCDESCPPDLDEDDQVDAADLLLLLAGWGPCPGPGGSG